jgi:hypothetical protein
MTPPETATKNPVGRPRVSVTPEQVRQLRSQGASWRQTAKALGIGTATAMRLVLSKDDGSHPNIHGDKLGPYRVDALIGKGGWARCTAVVPFAPPGFRLLRKREDGQGTAGIWSHPISGRSDAIPGQDRVGPCNAGDFSEGFPAQALPDLGERDSFRV